MNLNNDTKCTKCNCKSCCCTSFKSPACCAFQILRFTFTILPILAGLDKFFNFLTFWPHYLSAPFNIFGNPSTTMMVVGIIEIIAGILVWIMPRIFSYIVALWLLAIIINLLVLGSFFDIALRDFGLLLSALALGILSCKHKHVCDKQSCKHECKHEYNKKEINHD